MQKNKTGYTLIEILIVLAIIGILASIAVPLFLGQRTKAAYTEAKTNLESIRLLEEEFFAENNCYFRDAANACATTMLTYNGTLADDGGIEDFLPAFTPGAEADLLFIYTLTIQTVRTTADSFFVTALGKDTSIVKGRQLSINDQNVKSW